MLLQHLHRLPLRAAMTRLLRDRSFILQVAQSSGAREAPVGKLWIFSQAPAHTGVDWSVEPLDADQAIAHAKLDLADPDARVRLRGVAALSELDTDRTLSMLSATAVNARHAAVRQEAVFALSEARKLDMQTLTLALADSDAKVREATIEALAQVGGEESAQALAAAIDDEDASLRQEAVDALGEIGGPTATKLLQQALQDPDSNVRESAADYLTEWSQ